MTDGRLISSMYKDLLNTRVKDKQSNINGQMIQDGNLRKIKTNS
jgi:hypothetical protein